jgi:glycosyltransferase involved in cell wall biosynthesis
MLFFGNIARYMGLEYFVEAFIALAQESDLYRLVIVGRPKGGEDYWLSIQQRIVANGLNGRVVQRIEYVPDEQTELFFKAADVLVLPYTHIFQSGVLFLGYGFGLPVIAADVGALKEEIISGKTGLVFEPRNSNALAQVLRTYFDSALYRDLDRNRQLIRDYANERYSWTRAAETIVAVYKALLS